MPTLPLRTRIAPTPSGWLHQGNGASFVLTWVLARAAGGRVLLRIDDLDRTRFRMEYLDDIFYTLDWLGLDYDEGPVDAQDFLARFSQVHRLDLYNQALAELRLQELCYACHCSRSRIRAASPDGIYPGFCRKKDLDFEMAEVAWRVCLPAHAVAAFREWGRADLHTVEFGSSMGDFVVRQKDGMPAYQVASLCDDLHWSINFIVRGADLLPSTAAQVWLAQQIPGKQPFAKACFLHHALLTDSAGEKLSKSAGAASLVAWRADGRGPEQIYRQVAAWLTLPDEVYSLQTLLEATARKYAQLLL